MAKFSIQAGSTSQSVNIFIQNSSSTVGAGLTGLAYNTSNLIAYYTFGGAGTTATAITLATLSAVTSAYSSGGFKEIQSTDMPGLYRLDIPNAALASSNGNYCTFYLSGATNMAPCVFEIELTAINNQSTGFGLVDASANVVQWNGTNVSSPATAGIPDVNVKNINNVSASSVTTVAAVQGTTVAPTFTGSLVKVDVTDIAAAAVSATTAQLGVNVVNWNNTVVATPATAGIPDINVKNIVNAAAAIDGNNLLKVDTVDWMGTIVATPATAGIPDINVKNINNVSGSSVTTVAAVVGTTTAPTFTGSLVKVDVTDIATAAVNTSLAQLGVNVVNIKGTASAGAAGYVGPDWAAVDNPTSTVGLTGTTISTSQAVASVTGAVGSVTGAVGSVTGAVGSVTGNVGGNVTGSVGSISGVTFPTNFGTLLIDGSGRVTFVPGEIQWKKNTALANFQFPMTDSVNHAPDAGLTVTATRNIDNAGFGACANAVSAVGNGIYVINFAASDLNGNVVAFRFTATGADDLNFTVILQP